MKTLSDREAAAAYYCGVNRSRKVVKLKAAAARLGFTSSDLEGGSPGLWSELAQEAGTRPASISSKELLISVMRRAGQ